MSKPGEETIDLENARRVLPVEAELFVWLTVYGNLSLALRHPQNRGASRKIVEDFAKALGNTLVEEGVLTREQLRDAERLERQEGGLGSSKKAGH